MQPIDSNSSFRRRLTYILLGTAIGCMIAGLLWQMRYMAYKAQQEQQARQATPSQPAPAPAPGK